MKRNIFTLMAGALLLGMSSMSAMAAGKTIAVSWKTFQEERWKTDEAAIRAVVEAAGNNTSRPTPSSPPRSRPPISKA